MRVFFSPILVVATALLLTACSGGPEGATLQRGRSASSSRSPEAASAGASGAGGDANASSAPPSTPPPAPAAGKPPADGDAGTGTQPAPAPAPSTAALGSCGNPRCVGANGFAGCKATDGAGEVVTMGCQGGACGCFAGGQTTATFDGDVTSADDAAQLFLLNCTCN